MISAISPEHAAAFIALGYLLPLALFWLLRPREEP